VDNETILEEIANLGECTCPRLYKIVDAAEVGKGMQCQKHGFMFVQDMRVSYLEPKELEISLTIRMIPPPHA
jgi:hypothetical protein